MAIDYTKRPAPSQAPSGTSGSKVQLTKSSPSVSLTKSGGGSGAMRLNLSWTARPEARSSRLFASRAPAIDLDLGCLYDFSDGAKGVVQALGNAFTATTASGRTVISLDGDDRSGGAAGENLRVDLSRPSDIRRILFFAYIYEGVPNWAAADGLVTVFPQSGPQIETRLDATSDKARMCAIAMLEVRDGEVVLRRENQYINGSQRVLDETYHWGLRWSAGSK